MEESEIYKERKETKQSISWSQFPINAIIIPELLSD